MAEKRCDNGHYIDESWDICPFCPPDEPSVPVMPRHDSAADRTSRDVGQDFATRSAPSRDPRPSSVSGPSLHRTVSISAADAAAAVSIRHVVGWLVALNGAIRGESFQIRSGRNVIGRDPRADVVISDDQISAHHADLVYRPDERRFILMDHNSTNGTFVNEEEVEFRRDIDGDDVVRVGTHRLLFVPLCGPDRYWDGEGQLK